MKVKDIKGKVKAKVAAKLTKKGIATKAAKTCAVLLCAALCAALVGCSTADAPTAAKAQNITLEDVSVSVAVYAGTNAASPHISIELATAAQANEVGDGESNTFTATQTPTTDVKPQTDLTYGLSGGAGGGGVLETFLSSLVPSSQDAVKKLVASGQDGSVTVTKTDGSTDTVTCKGGVCSDSAGTCLSGKCSD